MRCHTTKEGHFIPGCMGAAAACGCGKTIKEIMECCTCGNPTRADLEGRIYELELRISNLETKLLKPHEL